MKVYFDPPGEFKFSLNVPCIHQGMQVQLGDDLYEVAKVRIEVDQIAVDPADPDTPYVSEIGKITAFVAKLGRRRHG